jgi:hypothetical protein
MALLGRSDLDETFSLAQVDKPLALRSSLFVDLLDSPT